MPALLGRNAGQGASTRQALVGVIRFSLVLADGNFFPALKGMSLTERMESIFDTTRMARRFDIFERYCLPSLRAQTDQDFNVVLLCSQTLPDMWKDRLERTLRNDRNIYARFFRTEANIQRVYKRSLHEMVDHDAPVYASFRLDDDDAIAPDFVARTRRYLEHGAHGHALTYSRGFRLGPSENGFRLESFEKPKFSAGLTYFAQRAGGGVPQMVNVYGVGPHLRIDEFVPTQVDNGPTAFLQTSHGANVSMRVLRQGEADLGVQQVMERIGGRFPWIDAEALMSLTGRHIG